MSGYRVTFINGTLDGFQKVFPDKPGRVIDHAIMAAPSPLAYDIARTTPPQDQQVRTETYQVYPLPGRGPGQEEIYVATLEGASAAPERRVAEAEDEICCANCGCNPATGQPYDAEPNALVDPYIPEPVAHGPHTGQG